MRSVIVDADAVSLVLKMLDVYERGGQDIDTVHADDDVSEDRMQAGMDQLWAVQNLRHSLGISEDLRRKVMENVTPGLGFVEFEIGFPQGNVLTASGRMSTVVEDPGKDVLSLEAVTGEGYILTVRTGLNQLREFLQAPSQSTPPTKTETLSFPVMGSTRVSITIEVERDSE